MFSAITLDGFRCFADPTSVKLGSLTVISGPNSVGKSSAINALMALVQSEEQQSGNELLLAGEWLSLGTFKQTVSYTRTGAGRKFALGITEQRAGEEIDVLWTFEEPENSTMHAATLSRLELSTNSERIMVAKEHAGREKSPRYAYMEWNEQQDAWLKTGHASIASPALFHYEPQDAAAQQDTRSVLEAPGGLASARRVTSLSPTSVLYLGAYRSPPSELYDRRRSRLGPLLGSMGEHTAEVILQRGTTLTDVLPEGTSSSPQPFGSGLNAWWSYIFGGPYAIRAEPMEHLGFTLSLDTPTAESLGLGQVGLGLSQALPVVTLGLCSKPQNLVVVESPEAHLHPGAQHRLTELFVALVRAGRQVILETHSEHIINALRLAIKRGPEKGGLLPEQVVVHFFTLEEGAVAVEHVPIDADGRLQKWPKGFFDQAAMTLMDLSR